ncbi:MAG: hypothetical protein JNM12_11885 [Alphaproteobacteria bacterium]|nr:hypothetical protein [Alphaproteobacteria bacterium]
MDYQSTKRFLILATLTIVLALSAVCSLLLYYRHPDEDRLARQSMMSSLDPEIFQQWGSLLNSPRVQMDYAAFEKIDFTFPGKAGYGNNSEEEFFNSAGPFKASMLTHPSIQGEPIFNVRRYFTKPEPVRGLKAMEYKALYVLLPVPLPCGVPPFDLEIPPDNHTVVTDPEAISNNCFKISDGLTFQFIPLAWKWKQL